MAAIELSRCVAIAGVARSNIAPATAEPAPRPCWSGPWPRLPPAGTSAFTAPRQRARPARKALRIRAPGPIMGLSDRRRLALQHPFEKLTASLAQYGIDFDAVQLHGLLTGYATIPAKNLAELPSAIAPGQAIAQAVEDCTVECIDRLADELLENRFVAHFGPDSSGSNRWLEGYFMAVRIHEADWEARNELSLHAGAKLIALHTIADPDLHAEFPELPGPADFDDNPQIVADIVTGIFHDFRGDGTVDEDILDDEAALDFSEEELAALDGPQLLLLLCTLDDQVPCNVIAECAKRGEDMVPLLEAHLENPEYWRDDVDLGDWWALLHAVFILGLIPGEASAIALLGAFRRITSTDEHDNLADWLSGFWPALCRNKTAYTTRPMRAIAVDHTASLDARWHAVDCVLAAAAETDPDALERDIDWLATLCTDPAEDVELRIMVGHGLLDLPRERHRPLMESLVDLQTNEIGMGFNRSDIERSFAVGDEPEFRRFDNPWQFYDPDVIRRRQQRWREEDAREFASLPRHSHEPYVREQPKVGRNEPCPCGSGRKYKKCCLRA